MDADQRDEIMRQALYNVGPGREQQERKDAAWRAARDPNAPDASVRWAAMMPKPEPPRPQPAKRQTTERAMPTTTDDAWNRWIGGHIERERKQTMDMLLALADEIAAVTGPLERKVNALNEEITLLRAELHDLHVERSAQVIDLPSWPMRDRDAA